MRWLSFHRQLHAIYGVTHGIPLLFLLRQHSKIHLATVQRTANSSAWNHILKLRRGGPDERKSQKLLSPRHTHGSAPRSPYYLPCQIIDQWKSSSWTRITECTSYRKKWEVDVVPAVALIAYMFSVAAHLWAMTYIINTRYCPIGAHCNTGRFMCYCCRRSGAS